MSPDSKDFDRGVADRSSQPVEQARNEGLLVRPTMQTGIHPETIRLDRERRTWQRLFVIRLSEIGAKSRGRIEAQKLKRSSYT